MKDVEIVLNPSIFGFAEYEPQFKIVEVSHKFMKLEGYEKYFFCRFLINHNYYYQHNVFPHLFGDPNEYNKKGRKFADELAVLQTIKEFPNATPFHIKLLYETKKEVLQTTYQNTEVAEQLEIFQEVIYKVSEPSNFKKIKNQNRSLSHKIKMFLNRFRVLDKQEAEKLNLVFLKNIHGDQINHLNCRSIWLDANMNEYRVKNYI